MKKLVVVSLLGSLVCFSVAADTVRQWDFNSLTTDTPVNGTRRPTSGIAAPAQSVGGVGNKFGTVSTATQPFDPNTGDNSHWRLGQIDNAKTLLPDTATGFPLVTNANKTAGALFPVNTSGYTNIHVTWNQENSASASKYWRIQYTTNGVDWLDTTNIITASSIDNTGTDTGTPAWQLNFAADFSFLPGVDNNPSFAFRIVSEFEATATGSGTNAYVANRTGTSYGTAGTMWLELVTVTGDSINPATQWPVISSIADQVVLTNEATAILPFTISDVETPDQNLTVWATCSDTNLISAVELGGSAGSRTVKVTPAAGREGLAVITVFVRDQDGKVSDAGFEVSVTTPSIFPIGDQITSAEAALTLPVVTTNLPGDPASQWTMTAGSSDTSVVPVSGIAFGVPPATSNYVTITPAAGSAGSSAIITITNTGPRGWQAVQSFTVRILPPEVVFFKLDGLPSSGGAPSWPCTNFANGLTVSLLTRGPGLRQVGLGNGFSSDSWNNTNSVTNSIVASLPAAVSQGEYYQFSVTVSSGFQASLATIQTSLRRSAIAGPMHYEWQYSLDGFATPGVTMTNFSYLGRSSGTAPVAIAPYQWMTKDTAGQDGGNPTWAMAIDQIAALQNVPAGTTITFRLYAWGNSDGADSNTVALGRFNGPSLRGSVTAVVARPQLGVRRSGADIVISWPASASGFSLQSTGSLSPANWQPAGLTPVVNGGNNEVTITNPNGSMFFRLAQ